MNIFKKFFPLFLFIAIMIIGIFLMIFKKEANIFSAETFLAISLIIIGGIGGIASFFIIKFNKPVNNYMNNDEDEEFSQKIRKEIYKFENEENLEIENLKQKEEIAHKKIKCFYCKCKFDSSLSRCPNCGAPPESEN